MMMTTNIKTTFFFTVFFVLVSFALSLPLYADRPISCPCFGYGDVMRYSHPPNVECWGWMDEFYREAERDKFNDSGETTARYYVTYSEGNESYRCVADVSGLDEVSVLIDRAQAEACYVILNNLCTPQLQVE